MSPYTIDYNEISSSYNIRYSENSWPGIKRKLISIVNQQKPISILEIGCGTGYWLNSISSLGVHYFGLDYSFGMIREAQKLFPKANYICADADKLPLSKNKFDFIFCLNAIHLFNNKFQFISEAAKLLTPKGSLLIIGYDPHVSDTDWYVYKYFDKVYKKDLERYPHFNSLKNEFEKAGLNDVRLEFVEQVMNNKNKTNVLSDHFLDQKGSSQMAMLTKEEYEIGLGMIKSAVNEANKSNVPLTFPVKLNFFSLYGKNI